MRQLLRHLRQERFSTWLLALLAVLLLISLTRPVFEVGHYNRMSADDFGYSTETSRVWQSTRSLPQVLSAAVKKAADTWRVWQGTFSAAFLFALQPGVFGVRAYMLTTYFLLGSFIVCNLLFFYLVLIRASKMNPALSVLLAASATLFSVETVPYASDSFFWFNGSTFYTFFYSLFLLLAGLIFLLPTLSSRRAKAVICPLCCLLALFVSGGNYPTCLLTAVCLVLFLSYFTLRRLPGRGCLYALSVVFFAGFLLNALAPGNHVRQDIFTENGRVPLSFFATVLGSFKAGGAFALHNAKLPLFLIVLFLLPALSSMARRSGLSFRLPVPVLLLGFCVFCSQFAPVIQRHVYGDARHYNIFYFSYVLLVLGGVFYLVGYLQRNATTAQRLGAFFRFIDAEKSYPVLVIAIAAACISLFPNQARMDRMTSARARVSLSSGQAARFADEFAARACVLSESPGADVVLKPFTSVPDLYHANIELWHKNWWVNRTVAEYYGNKSVTLDKYIGEE